MESEAIKGALSRGIFAFGGENDNMKCITPRKAREGNLLIFSKEEQTILSYGRVFHKTKEILEKINRCFQVAAIRILAIRSQTHLIIVSEN